MKCASGPEVGRFQQRACHDIFLVLSWLVVHAKWLLQVRVFYVWECFSVVSCKRERTREEKRGREKKEVREEKQDSNGAQHGSPQMVIV